MTKNRKKLNNLLNALAIISTIFFLLLLVLVKANNAWLNGVDISIASFFHTHRLRILDYVFVIISYLGESKVIVLFCLILLVLPNRKEVGIPVSITTGICALVNFATKLFVARNRPDGFFLTEPTLFYSMPDGYSFPSGHAQTANVFYASLFVFLKCNFLNKTILNKNKLTNWSKLTTHHFYNKKAKIEHLLIFMFCIMMCFARIYLAVHFLSDVLAGFALAILTICLMLKLAYQTMNVQFEYL